MLEAKPSQTLRGTWNEILTKQGEISPDSVVEVRVFAPTKDASGFGNDVGDYGGRSVYEVYKHLFGTVKGGPADLSERDEAYLANSDFGVTKNLRQLEP
jgi:hypothetical protein